LKPPPAPAPPVEVNDWKLEFEPSPSYLDKIRINDVLARYRQKLVSLPSAKLVCLGDIGIDDHRAAAKQAQAPTTEISHFSTLERDHRLIVVLERLRLSSPKREANRVVGVVDDRQFTFCDLFPKKESVTSELRD
jgi:hypothetical protein